MRQRTKIALAVAIALQSMTSVAQAQETLQRVEVTGSRIRQVDLETAQPVQVMTQEQIQKTGLITVGDIVNSMSVAGTPAFSKGSTLGASREQGGQFINMRNLGSQRLLVLVNGRRWTTTVLGYTDMSTVPASMIERIEVLKDGASSIYGSDAIAGVVNIILKKTMEGGTASAYVGQNEKGDGQNTDFALSYGAGSDKANLMFGLSHSDQGAVYAKDRVSTATSYGPGHLNAGFGASPWGRIQPVNPLNGGGLALNAAGNNGGFNRMINHTGTYDGVGTSSSSRDIANYHDYVNADEDTFNSSQQMMFTSPSRLTSIFTKGTLELPLGLRLSSTAMYAERSSTRQVAGYPLTSTSQSKYPIYIDKDSYYNPLGNQVRGAGQGIDLYFARRTTEVPRVSENNNRTMHIDVALGGDFAIAGKPWNWSTAYNYNSVEGTVLSTGNLNLLNVKRALGPSFMNASGVVQCGTAAAPVSLLECQPWDVVGGPSASNAAVLNYVMSTGQASYSSKVASATADLSGEVFKLPAGALGVAGGLEHRKVTGSDLPGQFEQSGYSTDLAGNSTRGKYTVKEAYLEVNVPVLKDLPFAQLLNFNLASRYSDYSNFGSTTNSKASFMWKPIRDLLARGTYAEGFRAPALGDSFGGGGQSFDSYLDPCDSAFGDAAGNTATRARCAAAGVPANFRQKQQSGANVPANGSQTPYPFVQGIGSGTLTPETAVTKTLGLVYSPSYVTGLTVGLDWFDIRIDNRITGVTTFYLLNQCYVVGTPEFCTSITRDATGQITSLSRGNTNLGRMATEGVDLSIGYRLPRTPYGQFAVRSETTYVDSFRTRSSATANWVEYAGEYYYNRVKSNLSVDWNMGNWSATWAARYYSGTKTRCWSNTATSVVECENTMAVQSWGRGYTRIGSTTYNDLSVAYAVPWKGKLLVGANNVFNKEPRIVYNTASSFGGNSSSSSVNPDLPIDRFFYVRYNQAF
jgi:iron complex outermembrane receptor protein